MARNTKELYAELKKTDLVNVTFDFETWKKYVSLQQDLTPIDKLVFPNEILTVPNLMFMTTPVGYDRGVMITAVSAKTKSFDEIVKELTELSTQYQVYLYQIAWQYLQVDGYTIDEFIVRYATGEKKTNE